MAAAPSLVAGGNLRSRGRYVVADVVHHAGGAAAITACTWGTVMDMAKILDSFHTAEFQYLPALAIPKGDTLSLKLNNPPSFHKPQSVLVTGLSAVQTPDPPVLRAVDAKSILCAQKKPLVLQVVGAPYIFASSYAHDFVFRVGEVDIPAKPDAAQGGFVLDEKVPALNAGASGTLHGYWGFDEVKGP